MPLKRAPKFKVTYHPEPWSSSEFELAEADDHPTALEVAAMKSREIYGRASPIIIRRGRKKIHEIPAGAGRSE